MPPCCVRRFNHNQTQLVLWWSVDIDGLTCRQAPVPTAPASRCSEVAWNAIEKSYKTVAMSQIAFSPAPSYLSNPVVFHSGEQQHQHTHSTTTPYIRRAAVWIKSHVLPEMWWTRASWSSPEVMLRMRGARGGCRLTAREREKQRCIFTG